MLFVAGKRVQSCTHRRSNPLEPPGTNTAAGSSSMKRNLDTGVEVCDNKVEKNQRHTTNEKPNMYLSICNKNNQYFDL